MDISTQGIDFLITTMYNKITKVIVYNGSSDVVLPIFKKEINGQELKLYAYLNESYVGTYSNFRFAGDDGIALLIKEPAENDSIAKDSSGGYLKTFKVNFLNN